MPVVCFVALRQSKHPLGHPVMCSYLSILRVNCTLLCNVLSTRIALSIKTFIGWLTLSLALLGVATLATGGLLQVVGLGPTTTAQGVRLVPALTERWSSLRLGGKRSEVKNNPSRLCSFNSQLRKSCLSTEIWITENHMFRHLCLKTSLTRLRLMWQQLPLDAGWEGCNAIELPQ